MKKRIILLCAAAALLLLAVLLFGDFSSYSEKTKTLPDGEEGLIFTLSVFDGVNESKPFVKSFGHAWVSLENRTDHPVTLCGYTIGVGEPLAFSVWCCTGRRGVYFNLEPAFIRQCGRYDGRQSLSMPIGEEKLAVIEAYIRENDDWTFFVNCSHWSLDLWNAIADESHQMKTQTLLYTPARLQKSFGEYDCVEYDRDFSGAKGYFTIENGERTELTLCE